MFQMPSTNQKQDFAVVLIFACHTFSISSSLLRQVLLGFLAGGGWGGSYELWVETVPFLLRQKSSLNTLLWL